MTVLKILGAVLLLALVLVTVVSLRSNAAALRPGATAPDIKAKAAVAGHVRDFDLKDQIGQHAVVLYFFPKAFTKGWTIEAKAYAARSADFQKLGARVVGISPDDPQTLVKFQQQTGAPFPMVSDVEKKAVKAYGADISVAGETIAKRITFVIGKNGKVLYSVFDWSPLPNVNKVYAWLKEHPQT